MVSTVRAFPRRTDGSIVDAPDRALAVDRMTGDLYFPVRCGRAVARLTSGGALTAVAGSLGSGSCNRYGLFVAVDSARRLLYLSDISLVGGVTLQQFSLQSSTPLFLRDFAGGGAVAADGKPGSLGDISGQIGVDETTGSLYVSDRKANAIRRITLDGTISTVVGQLGWNGTELGDLPARINGPTGVAMNPQGQLAIVMGFARPTGSFTNDPLFRFQGNGALLVTQGFQR